MMMPDHILPEFLIFASDAEIVGLWAGVMFSVALLALWGERRRMKRARIDRVGWMPWTTIFLASAIVGAGLLALSAKGLMSG